MHATDSEMVSDKQVDAAADLVKLPLSSADQIKVAELLGQWIPAALELSERMSVRGSDEIAPITAFNTPHSPSSTTL